MNAIWYVYVHLGERSFLPNARRTTCRDARGDAKTSAPHISLLVPAFLAQYSLRRVCTSVEALIED